MYAVRTVFFECFVVMWRTQFKCVCVCDVSDIIFRWQNNNFLYLQRFQFRHIHNFIRVRPSTFLYFINWKSISDESKESENHLIISILCFWTNAFLLRLSHQLQINYRAFALLAISKRIQIVKEVEENEQRNRNSAQFKHGYRMWIATAAFVGRFFVGIGKISNAQLARPR